MKRIITLISILVFFTQPLYGLAPQAPEWSTLAASSVGPVLAKLKDETDKDNRAGMQAEVVRLLSEVKNTAMVAPYWDTIVYNSDGSIEIVVDYVDKQGRSNVVLNRFEPADDGRYFVNVIRDEPQINNRIARGMLGLDLSRALVPAGDLDTAKETGLPQALAFRRGLIGEEPPEAGRLAYLYAVTDEGPIQDIRAKIAEVEKRMGTPIRVVVVLGMGGQSLGNRAVVQMLGSRDVKFIFPDNIANPSRLLKELERVNPREVLLYVSSKTGGTDETMTNFWFFWEWMIRGIGESDVADSLVGILKASDLDKDKLTEKVKGKEREGILLGIVLNRIVVSTSPGKKGPVLYFADNNGIPRVDLQEPIEGRYTILFRSGQFTTALAGNDIEAMRQAVSPLAGTFKEDTPELNPALESAMYAYALARPILVGVSTDKRLVPLFEWARQLVNESLGKEGKGPYLTFSSGREEGLSLMAAPNDKLFLVINVGEEKMDIPEGVSAIEINIPELNAQTLARIFLFLEEFTVRYGTFLGVNPLNQPWVDEFKKILEKSAEGFDTSTEARAARQAKADAVKEVSATKGVSGAENIQPLLLRLTGTDTELTTPVQLPSDESGFQALSNIGNYRQPGVLETEAQNLAAQLYSAEQLGKKVNPFFIYSSSPEARLVGEFIRYIGRNRIDRLAKLGGGILWDYLIGTTDQHSTAQYLGAGSNIALTTFLHFLQEPEPNPPRISANGLIHKRLDGKTPHEVSTLYMEAVMGALVREGRVTNTIEVPNEGLENMARLYQLLARTSELYARLVEYEGQQGGTTLGGLVGGNESTVIGPAEGVKAGDFGKEALLDAVDLHRAAIPMQISGVETRRFIRPRGVEPGIVVGGLKRFIDRVNLLARTILGIGARQGSALNRFVTAEELKEEKRPEFYVFRLEDAIARVEVGTEIGDLWEEIRVTRANAMIAKTIREIKRVNPLARVVVYTEDTRLTERRIETALDMIDCGGMFDMIVIGDSGSVLAKIRDRGWAKDQKEAVEKTVFASRHRLEELKSVILPAEKFIPFPELATVMQSILRGADREGRLPGDVIDTIVSSYAVWLELAGFRKGEITSYLDEMRESLRRGTNYIVTLPIPPVPRAGSVIELLDREYEEQADIKGYA